MKQQKQLTFRCTCTHWSHILSMLFHQLHHCWLDQTHNPNLSKTRMYWGCSRVPGVADRRANGGFHACVSAGRKQFARHEWAQKAAYLLGCTLEELSSSIFKHQAKGTLPRTGSVRQAVEEIGTADAGTPQTTFTHTLYPLGLSPLSCRCQSHVLFPHMQKHTSALITWGCEGAKAYLNITALLWLLTKHAHIVLGQTILDLLFIHSLGIIIALQWLFTHIQVLWHPNGFEWLTDTHVLVERHHPMQMLVAFTAIQIGCFWLTSKSGHQCKCFLNLNKVFSKCCHHSFIVAFTFYYLMLEMLMWTFFSAWLLLIPGSKAAALECLEAFASGLYSEIFTVLISLINRFVISFYLVLTSRLLYWIDILCFCFSGNMYYLKKCFWSSLTFYFSWNLGNWKKKGIILQFLNKV